MKALLFILCMISSQAMAEVSFQDCLDDGKRYAGESNPVTPLPECAGIVDAEDGKVEVSSGLYRAFGKDHIVYVDKKDSNGIIVEKILLSGDQTELVSIQKLFLDTDSRRLYIIQSKNSKNELMVYNLDFLGNVTPLNVMKSDTLFDGVTSIKAEGEDKIEIINASGSFLINSDAENRTTRSVQKVLTITPK